MKGGYTLEEDGKEAYDLLISLEGINDDTPIEGIAKIPSVKEILRKGQMLEATKELSKQSGLITFVLSKKDKIEKVGDLKDMKLEKDDMKVYQLFENTFFLEPEGLDMFLQFGIVALTTLQSKMPEGKLNDKEANTVRYTLLVLDQLQKELRGNDDKKMTSVAGKKKSRALRSRRRTTGGKMSPKRKLKTQKRRKGSKNSKKMKQMGGVLGDIMSWFYPAPSTKEDSDKKANSITNIFKRIIGRQEMPEELTYYHGEIISVLSDKHKQRFKELLEKYIKDNRAAGKSQFVDTFTGNAVAKEILKRVVTEIDEEVKNGKGDEEDKSVSQKLAEIRSRNKPTKEELEKIEQDASEVFDRLTKQEVNQLFEKYYVKGKDFEEGESKLIKAVERKEGKSKIISDININFYKMMVSILVIMLNNFPDALTTMAVNVEQGMDLKDSPLQDMIGFLLQFRTLLVFIGGFIAFSKYIVPTALGQSGLIVNIANVVNSGFWFMAYQSQDAWKNAKKECEGQGTECVPNLEYDYLESKKGGLFTMNYGEQVSVYGTNMLYGFSNFFLRFIEIILDNIDKYGTVIIFMLCMVFMTIAAVHIKNNKGKLAKVSETVRDEHRKAVKESAFNITDINKYVEKTQAGAPGGTGIIKAQEEATKAYATVQDVVEKAANASRADLNIEIQARIADANATMASVAARNSVAEGAELSEPEKVDAALLLLNQYSVPGAKRESAIDEETAKKLGVFDLLRRLSALRTSVPQIDTAKEEQKTVKASTVSTTPKAVLA